MTRDVSRAPVAVAYSVRGVIASRRERTAHRPREGPGGTHPRGQGRRPPAHGARRRGRAVAARGLPRPGHRGLDAVPLLPQPGRAADRADHRCVQPAGRGRRGRGRRRPPGRGRMRRPVARGVPRGAGLGAEAPARVRARVRVAGVGVPGTGRHGGAGDADHPGARGHPLRRPGGRGAAPPGERPAGPSPHRARGAGQLRRAAAALRGPDRAVAAALDLAHRHDQLRAVRAPAQHGHRLRRVLRRGGHAQRAVRGPGCGRGFARFTRRGLTSILRSPGGQKESSMEEYDFVIVGGGSAGSALANRLSADPGHRVLVLEAGRPDYRWDTFIHMPAALTYPIGNRFYDWKYESEPEPLMHGRRIYHARGKVLGGSSSINGMIFQRGNPLDYERWAADPGMGEWDYAHCLPYFKKMENCLAADAGDRFRGRQGPLVLERGPASSPLFKAFFAAVQQAGYPLTDDVNGYRQEGFNAFDRNIHNGRRLSAARAYLHPVLNRPNLDVVCRALVSRIVFEGTRATGVEYTRGSGAAQQARASEVIVCGGAINTPQLLQLSGVGNAADLATLGIDTVADLPGVGQNLQDHLEVYVQYASKLPVSVAPALKWRNRPMVGARWLFARSGPGATNHFEGGGFVRSNSDVAYPNLMFHFLPIAIRYDGSAPAGGHGYQVHIGPMYSDSRGSVKIISRDPAVHP